ncbi:hypothetical protein J2741_002567 [Methanolinea mesophila]|uniref:polyphosphate polymerase domain-containing protein n=1 Tax=Methanolinea mesophila TaxID=547055 RepID=UPI001AE39480|nr:polyphosphate polymerase domain-containing protein [Methanolinea mesophila]MBP1929971.1 hypothetical protein [Methanolinea mesophila]
MQEVVAHTGNRPVNERLVSDPGFTPALQIQDCLGEFERISLGELDATRALLLTRMERKHLMSVSQCGALLRRIRGSYRVLEVQDTRVSRYETLYFDNASFVTYIQHHNGKGNRYKLRFRHYESSGDTYLEVKKKSNRGSTEKTRIRTGWPVSGFLPEHLDFLKSAFPYDCREFRPVLLTEYDRFTLVSKTSPERITFDTGVSFWDGRRTISYPDLVICEVKFEKGTRNSPALSELHDMGIRKQGFSKYCIGASLLYDRLKHNRFKPTLLSLSRFAPAGGVSC